MGLRRRLVMVSVRVGATDESSNRKEFIASDACKDNRLLVVSQTQVKKEEKKRLHKAMVGESSFKWWSTASKEEERTCLAEEMAGSGWGGSTKPRLKGK